MESQRLSINHLKGKRNHPKPVRLLVHLLPLFVSWHGTDAPFVEGARPSFLYSTYRKITVISPFFFHSREMPRDVACHALSMPIRAMEKR